MTAPHARLRGEREAVQMTSADEAEIRQVLAEFRDGVRSALGENLIAIYVNGSLTMGDFEPASSDLDFLVVIRQALTDDEIRQLDAALREYLSGLLARPRPDELSPGSLASRVLNIARCLYGLETGRACTKVEAARWLGGHEPAVRPVHLGDLREHVAFPVRLARARAAARGCLQLLCPLPHRGSFLVRESRGRHARRALRRLPRVGHSRFPLCEI